MSRNTGTNAAHIQSIVYTLEAYLMSNPDHRAPTAENRRHLNRRIREWTREADNSWPPDLVLTDWVFNTNNAANGFAFQCGRGEVIIGVAGTNLEHWQQGVRDILANGSIFFGGLSHHYFRNLVQLMNRLGGPSAITAITGHSLGGAVAEVFGITHGIQPISFNGAPMWGLPSKSWQRFRLLLNANGIQPTRFVTHNDWLQLGVTQRNVVARDRTYRVPGGGGHARSNFLEASQYQFVGGTWARYALTRDRLKGVTIGFSAGDFSVPPGLRSAGDLLKGSISINPETLRSAMSRMMISTEMRFGVIHEGITLSLDQNRDLRDNRDTRTEHLASEMFFLVDEAGLRRLFSSFSSSYGEIAGNLATFNRVVEAEISPHDLRTRFETRHNISATENVIWQADGVNWNNRRFHQVYNSARNAVSGVLTLIERHIVALEQLHVRTGVSRHPRTANNLPVGIAYISRLNRISEEAVGVTRGVDEREGRRDAIVSAVDEAFEVLRENVSVAFNKVQELATQGEIIADNTENFDRAAANVLSSMSGFVKVGAVGALAVQVGRPVVQETETFNVTRTERLSNGLIRAREEQAVLRRQELNTTLQNSMRAVNDVVLQRAPILAPMPTPKTSLTTLSMIPGACESAVSAIDAWFSSLDRRISSTERSEEKRNITTDEWSMGVTIPVNGQRIERLQLSQYISEEIRSDMRAARTTLNNWVRNFETTRSRATSFSNDLPGIRNELFEEVGKAIYPPNEFNDKLKAVKTIGQMLCASATEYSALSDAIRTQMSGATIRGYADELERTAIFFEDIVETIREDFSITI